MKRIRKSRRLTPPRDSRGRFVSLKKSPKKAPQKAPKKSPKKAPQKAPKKSPKKAPQKAPQKAPKKVTRRIRKSRIRLVDEAMMNLGTKAPRGRHFLVEKGPLTPTKRGFGALESAVRELSGLQSKKALYSFDLVIRYHDPQTGRMKTAHLDGIGIPRLVDVKKYRKRKESLADALAGWVEMSVRGAVFTFVKMVYQNYRQQVKQPKTAAGRKQQLRRMKAKRQVRFKVRLYREQS